MWILVTGTERRERGVPTIKERIERLRALKEADRENDRKKEVHRLSCLEGLSKRARDLVCL